MECIINGEKRSFASDRLTIRQLLQELDVSLQRGVAVALNNAVIPQSEWDEQALNEGDHVEVIRATQGG